MATNFLDEAMTALAPATGPGEPIVFRGDLSNLAGLVASASASELVDGVMQLVTFALFLKNQRGSPTAADAFLKSLARVAEQPLVRIGQRALAQTLQRGVDAFGGAARPDAQPTVASGGFESMQHAAVRRTNERALELLQKRIARAEGGIAKLVDPASLALSAPDEPPFISFRTFDGSAATENSPGADALRTLLSDRLELGGAVIGKSGR